MQHATRQENPEHLFQWQYVCDAFKAHYSPEEFKSWLNHCQFEAIRGNTAIINAPTRFTMQRIQAEYGEKLAMFWGRINSDVEEVRITIGRSKPEPEEEKPQTAQIIQLPLWPEPARGTPNAVLRGALFAAIDPRKRQAFQRVTLVDEKNLKIIFTGIQLDQSDLDVWETALHMARQQPLGTDIYFTAHGFLKALGRSTGKSQHEWLKKALARLLGCGVEITHNGYTYGGNLLEFEREEDTQHYKLSINPKMRKIYDAGWTQSDFEERKRIGNRKFLALWLHGYIASHAELYPMKIETFYRLSGSTNSDMYGFKRYLKKALDHLKDIDLIRNYSIDDKNLVHIEKYPTDSQRRYLKKMK